MLAGAWIESTTDRSLIRFNHFWSDAVTLTTLPTEKVGMCLKLADASDFVRDKQPPFVVL